ncbi:MAG: XRE family transcriptional regulator [Clostridia bacterium]|nr:XRE family transcriptional regulator [Clostridia bacterium]
MSIGSNIRKRRYELRMTQQELADLMGYKTRSTIAKIESGENDISQKKLQKLAEVLDTTVQALISGYLSENTSALINAADTSEKKNKNIVVILAGGKSGRNRQNIPSQFINVQGKPIIVYCMEKYQSHPMIDDIFVVCLKGWESIVRAYANEYGITKLKSLIPAGISGIDSLKKALDCIKNRYNQNDLIIIQEATRPMVTTETISNLLQACETNDSATICHYMNDYVQFNIGNKRAQYIDRNTTVALQSPEAHRLFLMNRVFDKAQRTGHTLTETCCTMLLYNLGYDINFIESSNNNIKIVREEDIATFSALMNK